MALGDRRAVRVAGRELDEGLSQQRLLAQDGPGRGVDRGVPALDLQRGHRAVALRVQVLLAHLADRHPGLAHVGLQAQLGGLGERHLELVALGLEGDRAAEREPQEQEQPEAGQREQHHREDPAE